jgi:KDO2-lipid IV(A) lauroyltransferase
LIFEESPLRDAYRLAIWGPYRQALGFLPYGWELGVNRRLGRAVALGSRGSLARIERNLRRAFPDRDDLAQVAARTFGTHFQHQYLPVSFPRVHRGNLDKYVEIRGLEHVDRALRGGKGVVLMHPHMGPVQLPLHGMGLLGYPVHQVGGGIVPGLSRVGEWAAATRMSLESAMPVTVHDGRGFLRPVLRALKSGGVIMATCDGTGGGQELGRRLVRPVCGQPMRVPVSPVWLAHQAGAPLLPLVTHRSGHRSPRHLCEIGSPLDLPRGLPRGEALAAGADLVADFLTDSLSRFPEDWHFWDHFEPGRFLQPTGEGGP